MPFNYYIYQVIRADQSCNGGKCSFSDGDCKDSDFFYLGETQYETYEYTETNKECSYFIINMDNSDEFRLTFTQSDDNPNPIQYAKTASTSCAETDNYIRISNVNIIGRTDQDISFLFCGDKYPPPYVSIHEATNVTVKYDHKVNMTFKIEDVPKGM